MIAARAHIILMHGILHEGLSQWGGRGLTKSAGILLPSVGLLGRQLLPVFSPLVVFGVNVAQLIGSIIRYLGEKSHHIRFLL